MTARSNPAKTYRFTVKGTNDAMFYVNHLKTVFDEYSNWAMIYQNGDAISGYVSFKDKCRFPARTGNHDNIDSSIYSGESPKKLKEKAVEECNKYDILYSRNISTAKIVTIERELFYPWQEELVQILEEPCVWDDRTIYWRYGDINIGKTQFARWLCTHLGAYVIGGTHRHMLAQVQNADAPIYIVLLSYGDEKVSYRAIEQIKDGLFSSSFGCDNNKMTIRNSPHILVIGNEEPDYTDRNYHPTKYNVARVGPPKDESPSLEPGTTEPGNQLCDQPTENIKVNERTDVHRGPCYMADEEDNIPIPDMPRAAQSAYCEFTMDTDIPGYEEKHIPEELPFLQLTGEIAPNVSIV